MFMDLYTAIKNRRSHRLYKPDPVPREVLERVIEAAFMGSLRYQSATLGYYGPHRPPPG